MRAKAKENMFSFKSITEISNEWIVMQSGMPVFKKFGIITSVVKGKIHNRFCVYHGKVCVLCTKDEVFAVAKYNNLTKENIPTSSGQE
jgi:hypothetical protein